MTEDELMVKQLRQLMAYAEINEHGMKMVTAYTYLIEMLIRRVEKLEAYVKVP